MRGQVNMVVEAKLRSPIHSTFDALVVLPQPVGGRKCFSWFLFWLIKMCLGLVKMISNSGSESEITFAPTKYFCFTGYIKTFDCVDHNKLWKILREMGIPDHLTCSWEIYMRVKKQQLEPDMEKWTGSKFGKEYIKAIYCHSNYLTYM